MENIISFWSAVVVLILAFAIVVPIPGIRRFLQPPPARSFQSRVADWLGKCFAPPLYTNMTERGDRLVEEVLELLQSKGYDPTRIPTLIEYVWNRPVGDPPQEVGGVMATLAAYCSVAGLDMEADGEAELARIMRPEIMAKIRTKQEAKNKLRFDSPLPGNPTAHPAMSE
jgi:hypothetical protein